MILSSKSLNMLLEELNVLKTKYSQCACCERPFLVVSEEVLYCSKKCKVDHDMFRINQEIIQKNARHEARQKYKE